MPMIAPFQVRHDCPSDGPSGGNPDGLLPALRVEDLTSSEESRAFDDGGYVRFEPEPHNRFR